MSTTVHREFCKKALVVACAGAASSLAPSVAAQSATSPDTSEMRGTIRVDVTGTHIRRSEVESALPVQVITREDIDRGGFTTVAGLMASVSANIGAFTDALSIGVQFQPNQVPRPGLSSVNLRGIGDGSTLLLINGRRVANYAFDGGAVDVNSIPVVAIDRVEILKDGASAIYGTDAIAGVVNFILRKDYRGIEVTGYGGWTQQGGGDQYQASVTAGYGDLATDKFNAFVTLNHQRDEVLRGTQRGFTGTGFRPDVGVVQLARWTFPANIVGPEGLVNPSFNSGCTPPSSRPIFGRCGFDSLRYFDVLPQADRTSAFGRATFQLDPQVQLFAEIGYAYNKFSAAIAPTAAGDFPGGSFPQFFYPEGGPYYPVAFAAANGLSGDLNLLWRTVPLGSRVNDVETRALRAVLGAEGSAQAWDYSAAIVYSDNRQEDQLASGYVSASRLSNALATGLVNPFGPSGPEGDALLQGTSVSGDFHTAKGTTWLIDAKASKNLLRLPGGSLAIALGAEARREQLDNTYLPLSNDALNVGGNHPSTSASRNVQALYAEASVPFASGFESQFAVRYDRYSDFGGTVNPKVALRWQPAQSLLLRASLGTGFRTPTLYDLHTPLQQTLTAPGGVGDPVRCPVTQDERDCAGEFPALFGGNPNLKPETSEQFNAGVVWSPAAGLSLSLDYWNIRKKNLITGITENETLAPGARFASTNVIRGPIDPNYPGLPGPIELVLLQTENFGDLRTSGFDVGFKWRAPATSFGRFGFGLDGTYVSRFSIPGFGELAGNNNGPYAIPRWRHYASADWNYGPWSATLAQVFQNGYDEVDTRYCDDMGCPTRRVGSYSVWNVQGQYTGLRNTTLTVGVKNLFDRDPPWVLFPQLGFDGGYADPRGRTFYARLAYAFR